jgi:hypothetical protein
MSLLRRALLAALLAAANGLQLGTVHRPAVQARARAAPQMAHKAPTAAGAALATSLALAMATMNPTITQAAINPPAVVQQAGANMIAETDAELREAQKKFLEERAKIKQEYDGQTESNFVNADDFSDKKSIYVTIVGGLLVVAFVAPMLQFFYYTGGD